jgi:hypothetical protein
LTIWIRDKKRSQNFWFLLVYQEGTLMDLPIQEPTYTAAPFYLNPGLKMALINLEAA